jgi:hypothetical protein
MMNVDSFFVMYRSWHQGVVPGLAAGEPHLHPYRRQDSRYRPNRDRAVVGEDD